MHSEQTNRQTNILLYIYIDKNIELWKEPLPIVSQKPEKLVFCYDSTAITNRSLLCTLWFLYLVRSVVTIKSDILLSVSLILGEDGCS